MTFCIDSPNVLCECARVHARMSACLRVYLSISQPNGPHLSLDVVGYRAEANEHISAGIDYPVHILHIAPAEVSYGVGVTLYTDVRVYQDSKQS